MGRRRSLTVLCLPAIMLSCLAAIPTGTAETAPEPGAAPPADPALLYLRGDRDAAGRYNFTTEHPAETQPERVDPFSNELLRNANWIWRMDRAPHPWTLPAGARITAVVYFDGLDQVVPSPGSPPGTGSPGALRVEAHMLRGGTQSVVASGEAAIPHDVLDGNRAVRAVVELEAPNEAHYDTAPGNAPYLGLQVTLHGLVRQDAPPVVLAGGTAATSHIVLPGFPLDAFRAWEAQKHCHELLLDQRPCAAAPAPAEAGTITQEAPPPHVILVLLASLAISRGRARKTQKMR